MKIAVVSMIRDAWGGSEQLWYEMAKEAFAEGHEVIHVAFETPHTAPQIRELERLGLQRIARPGWIPPGSSPSRRLFHLGRNYLRKKLSSPFDALARLKPDRILYNGTCYSIAGESDLLRFLKQSATPYFILGQLNQETLRGISDAAAETVRRAYAGAKEVYFVSERNRARAELHLCTSIPNAVIVRNPVNLVSTGPLSFPEETTVRLACVANLVTVHKGQDLLLEALAQWEVKDWQLSLFGKGYDEAYLRTLCRQLGLEEKVRFMGTTSDIRSVWQEHHALVLPSHMEGMPLAIVEAMLCGRVCIVTDVGGAGEWIEEGKSGFLAPAPTAPLLLQALRNAWSQKAAWPTIGAAARQAALHRYDPKTGASLLRRIIAP
jgi:glycosyltransferase involved in cell wall biosynthesis